LRGKTEKPCKKNNPVKGKCNKKDICKSVDFFDKKSYNKREKPSKHPIIFTTDISKEMTT